MDSKDSKIKSMMKNVFLGVEIKRFMFLGKISIAIFLTDASDKVRLKAMKMLLKHKKELAKQAENFTSTVSHEMQTPLGSILFFIGQLEKIIDSLAAHCFNSHLPQTE